MKDYYQILEVSKDASSEEIKRAYRNLAVKYHPDKNNSPEAIAIFQEINEANNVLSDSEKRRKYDQPLTFLWNEIITVSKETEVEKKVREQSEKRKKRNEAKQYSTEYKEGRAKQRTAYFAQYINISKIICFAVFIFASTLIVDLCLTEKIVQEVMLIEKENNLFISKNSKIVYLTDKELNAKIKDENVLIRNILDNGYFKQTNIFKIIIGSTVKEETAIEQDYPMRSSLICILFFLFTSSFIGVFFVNKDSEALVNIAYVAIFFTIVITVVILFPDFDA